MKYAYYPGCSRECNAAAYDYSVRAVVDLLGIKLQELDDWNCCGATEYFSQDELTACAVIARNLALDDILDTGKTLSVVVQLIKKLNPASVRTCVLLDKRGRREVEFVADFVGFQIPDTFVVGYGLDFAERYRNLPYIGVLKPHLQNPPEWA